LLAVVAICTNHTGLVLYSRVLAQQAPQGISKV